MKFHLIGHLALRTRHVTALEILEVAGKFDLSKKIFSCEGSAGTSYYQAETAAEDRDLRMRFRPRPSDIVFLEKETKGAGGGYR